MSGTGEEDDGSMDDDGRKRFSEGEPFSNYIVCGRVELIGGPPIVVLKSAIRMGAKSNLSLILALAGSVK